MTKSQVNILMYGFKVFSCYIKYFIKSKYESTTWQQFCVTAISHFHILFKCKSWKQAMDADQILNNSDKNRNNTSSRTAKMKTKLIFRSLQRLNTIPWRIHAISHYTRFSVTPKYTAAKYVIIKCRWSDTYFMSNFSCSFHDYKKWFGKTWSSLLQ